MLSPMLELERVSKRYGTLQALSEVSIRVERGQTTVLIGASGSGKSTALRMFNGLVRPDGGRVLTYGEPLAAQDLTALRRRMGYVIQGGGLFPHMTARRNVALLAQHMGRAEAWIQERLLALLALTRLPKDVLDRYPDELSGGQQQRVSLMRALMLEPDVLLLDEPFGALDPVVRLELQRELKAILDALGATAILVTHDLSEAALFADRVALLDNGRILQQGTMRSLMDAPADAQVARFIDAQRAMLQQLESAR